MMKVLLKFPKVFGAFLKWCVSIPSQLLGYWRSAPALDRMVWWAMAVFVVMLGCLAYGSHQKHLRDRQEQEAAAAMKSAVGLQQPATRHPIGIMEVGTPTITSLPPSVPASTVSANSRP